MSSAEMRHEKKKQKHKTYVNKKRHRPDCAFVILNHIQMLFNLLLNNEGPDQTVWSVQAEPTA